MTINVCDICEGRYAQRVSIPVGHSIDPPSGKTETDHDVFELCPKHLSVVLDLLLAMLSEERGCVIAAALKRRQLPALREVRAA